MEWAELLSFDHVSNERIKRLFIFLFFLNMGPLKVLSDTKLIQYKSEKPFVINLITFRTFRSPFFYKQESGRAFFLRMVFWSGSRFLKKIIKVIFCTFLTYFFQVWAVSLPSSVKLFFIRSPFNVLRHHVITKSLMKLSKFFSLMSLWSINMAPKVYKNHPQKALVPMITQLCSNTDSKHKWRF